MQKRLGLDNTSFKSINSVSFLCAKFFFEFNRAISDAVTQCILNVSFGFSFQPNKGVNHGLFADHLGY